MDHQLWLTIVWSSCTKNMDRANELITGTCLSRRSPVCRNNLTHKTMITRRRPVTYSRPRWLTSASWGLISEQGHVALVSSDFGSDIAGYFTSHVGMGREGLRAEG
jgi:hypothetical protein